MPETTRNAQSAASAFLPILLIAGAASVACSLFFSNYAGMGLALMTLIAACFTLQNVSRKSWNSVMALVAIGFFIGFSALLMKLVMMNFGE